MAGWPLHPAQSTTGGHSIGTSLLKEQLDLRAPASCAWNLPPFGLSAKVQQELTVTWEAASLSLIGAISPMLQQQVSLEIATDVASSAIEYAFQRGEGGFGVI